eukprot:1184421-Karenia_brevis.AAC.1
MREQNAMMRRMSSDLYNERREKAQLIHQSSGINTTHVIPVEHTPDKQYASGAVLTGRDGTATVYVGKDVAADKVTTLPIGSHVPVPPIVSPPPNSPSKFETLKQSAI